MTKMKLKFIKRFDIFGKQILLRFNSKDKHRTSCGGIATLLIISAVSIQIISTIQELILKEKPDVIYNQQYVKGVEIYKIDFDEFHFAIGMEDNNYQHFFDESVYNIKAQQIISIRNNQTNQMDYQYDDITLERCTSNNFKNPDVKDYFLRQPYTNLYCIKDQNKTLEFGGDFDLGYFSMVQLKVSRCTGANCKVIDQANYEKYYKYPKIAMYFNDVLTDPKNRNPFTKIGRDLYFLTSETLQKDITLFMVQNKVSSSEGWLLSKEIQHEAIGFSQYQELSLVTTKEEDLLFTISVRLEKKKENKWTRKYLTLSQGLSQIGGIYQALIAIGCLCIYPISQFELNRKLMNQIFSFENSSSQIKEIQSNNNKKQIKFGSIVQKNNLEEEKSIAAGREIRSMLSNNLIPRDYGGTIQMLSQNSLTIVNGLKGEKSLAQIEITNLRSPKKKTILLNDLMNQPVKFSEESAQLSDPKKKGQILLEVVQPKTKPHSFDNNSPINYSQNTQNNHQTAPNQSPTQHQSQLAQQMYGQQLEKANTQRVTASNKINQRQNKKKSKTLFLNQLSVSTSQFAAQKSQVNINQMITPTKFKQTPQLSLDVSQQSPSIKQKSQQNIPMNGNATVLNKKEKKELKQKEKQYLNILKDINKKFQNYFKVTANRIKINLLEYIRYFMCPPRSLRIKKEQMDYGMKKLYHHLDIVYIIKKLTEIDKLKILLLNEKQIKLFEYLPRPKIYIQSQSQCVENQGSNQIFNFLYQDMRTEIERAKDAFESFKAITQENYIQTKQDKKLLKMIDPHLLELFDEQMNEQQQINQENLDELTLKDDLTEKNSKFVQKRSIPSPHYINHNGKRASLFQPEIDHHFISHQVQSETPSSQQAENNNFREETFEDSEYNQSSHNDESLKENLQQIELKMQQFQTKKFSIDQIPMDKIY